MPQSLVQLYVHLVFSTKHRQPFLRHPGFRERTHAYLIGVCNNQGSPSPSMHVGDPRLNNPHILFPAHAARASRNTSSADE
jgi:hypothetical protein